MKSSQIKIVGIIIILAHTFTLKGQINPRLAFQKLTTSHGLSHSTVYAITQDNKGFMWFGTREGLNRYDSYKIKAFYANENDTLGLTTNHITALASGLSETLLIGTAEGLHLYDYQTELISRVYYKGRSLGFIYFIYQTADENFFICTNKGLYSLKDNKIEILIADKNILGIQEYKRNVFWVISSTSIALINEYGQTIKDYNNFLNKKKERVSINQNLENIFIDSGGDVWVGSNKSGLLSYHEKLDSFIQVESFNENNPLETNLIRSINEDKNHNLWLGTESGLFIFDKKNKSFEHIGQSLQQTAHSLNDKAIYSIFISKEDIIWVGTYFGGINYHRQNELGFYTLKAGESSYSLSGKAVSQITQSSDGKLWIGTEDGGINVWDRKTNQIEKITHNSKNSNSLSINNVHAIEEAQNGEIWIGTFLGGLNRYNPDTKVFKFYGNDVENPHNSKGDVYSVLEDSSGNIWSPVYNGISKYNPETDRFVPFRPDILNGKFIYHILEDKQNNIWFCTRENGIYKIESGSEVITEFSTSNNAEHKLSSNVLISAMQDSKGDIWFGTMNGGLIKFDYQKQIFQTFTKTDGLPNNYVYGILEDTKQKQLWISTNRGLSQFDIESETFTNFNISHGLVYNQFNFKSSFKDDQGWMYFGTVNGLTYFHPDSLQFQDQAPEIYFSDFTLFNKSVNPAKKSVLNVHIDHTENITLDYSENVFSIEFVAVNYASPGNNEFEYYLEGFEEDWNGKTLENKASYTNLAPGNYTFRVRVAGKDSLGNSRLLRITVLPPWWLTIWAYIGYIIFLGLVFWLYMRFVLYKKKEEHALQLERLEKEKMLEINQQKLNFFTYITHEFKTPLTLIIASIDRFLRKDGKLNGNSLEFNPLKRNATRLQFLIDQLMEFRKIETSHSKINWEKGDLILFLEDTFSAFIPLFAKKNLHYKFIKCQPAFITFFDTDKIEKIITNIVSNAIKNTPEFGEVSMEVSVNSKTGYYQIQIIDTGEGLNEGESSKIFMPFYKGENQRLKTTGSGIGLALVKSLINLLEGAISIDSNQELGTIIKISLPIIHDVDKKEQTETNEIINGNKNLFIDQDLFLEEELSDSTHENQEVQNDFELLIVEDNIDLLKFLANHFKDHYQIVTANNGKVALEKIMKKIPDVVISDVIMTKMDGITLCKELKNNINTSHIPVILLTSKSDEKFKIDGLDMGADAYLPKPFNLKELELIIKNIIDSRNNLKKHFLDFGHLENHEIPLNNRDQDFLMKLTQIVHDNLSNSDFNITTFSREAGISRTLLHTKLKKLVNLSASEFIKNIRLQKAAKLLKETDQTVSEVAYLVGYSDPNYFSKSFKEKYHVSPSLFKTSSV